MRRRTLCGGVLVLLLLLGGVLALRTTEPVRTPESPHARSLPESAPEPLPRSRPVKASDAEAPAAAEAVGQILVVGPDGAPVADAVVDASPIAGFGGGSTGKESVPIGRTAADGRVAWPRTPVPMPALLCASHPEYAPGDIVVSREGEDVTLRLGRGFAVAGEVVDPDGRGVPGAAVLFEVLPTHHALGTVVGMVGTRRRDARTSSDGRFRIVGVPSASMGVLTARAPGFVESSVWWDASASDPERVRIVLPRAFRAAVRLVDPSGRSLSDGVVLAFDGPVLELGVTGAVRAPRSLAADGAGLYVTDRLVPGWYRVLATHPGHGTVVVASCPLHADGPPHEVVLSPALLLRGAVTDAESGLPVAGAEILALPLRKDARRGSDDELAYLRVLAGHAGALAVRSDAEGRFTLDRTAAGDDVAVTFRADGYAARRLVLRDVTERTPLDVALSRLPAVACTGRVVGPDGVPVVGAVVAGEADTVTTDADGRFRLVTRQASGNVTVAAPGFASRWIAVPAGPTGVDLGDVALARLVETKGIVVDASGVPEHGRHVSAAPRTAGAGAAAGGTTAVSDIDGRFGLLLVPGETYDVRCDGRTDSAVEVVGGQDEFRLVAAPREARGRLSGRLTLDEGPWTPTPCVVIVRLADRRVLTTTAAPDGTFAFASVAAGRWDLRVGLGGVEGDLAGVDVPAGGEASVSLPCRRVEADAPADRVPLTVQIDDAPPGVVIRATSVAGRSIDLRSSAARWTGDLPRGAIATVWVSDVPTMRAAVAPADPAAGVVTIELAPAGRLVIPRAERSAEERHIVLRDGRGAVVYSGLESALPAVAGEGHVLVLPPGEWTIEISRGTARRDARTLRGVVTVEGTTLPRE